MSVNFRSTVGGNREMVFIHAFDRLDQDWDQVMKIALEEIVKAIVADTLKNRMQEILAATDPKAIANLASLQIAGHIAEAANKINKENEDKKKGAT